MLGHAVPHPNLPGGAESNELRANEEQMVHAGVDVERSDIDTGTGRSAWRKITEKSTFFIYLLYIIFIIFVEILNREIRYGLRMDTYLTGKPMSCQ